MEWGEGASPRDIHLPTALAFVPRQRSDTTGDQTPKDGDHLNTKATLTDPRRPRPTQR